MKRRRRIDDDDADVSCDDDDVDDADHDDVDAKNQTKRVDAITTSIRKLSSKTNQKSKQNGPREVPGVSLGMPGGLPGTSQEAVGTFFEVQRRSMTMMKRPGCVTDPILGSGQVPKIDQKLTFC